MPKPSSWGLLASFYNRDLTTSVTLPIFYLFLLVYYLKFNSLACFAGTSSVGSLTSSPNFIASHFSKNSLCHNWKFAIILKYALFGEGNGTPLQYFCLENPMDGGAWWAAVHGVARVGHDWATSLSRIGEGNGNPLQCSCLENPRDGGACWAAVYGVALSRTRLKWISSSSSSMPCYFFTQITLCLCQFSYLENIPAFLCLVGPYLSLKLST